MMKPWITPYADERHEGAFAFDGTKVFFPASTGIVENREYDVLWQPTPERPTGAVFWSEMHTGRQRQAMAEGLCQVCGKSAGSPASWLLPNLEVRLTRPNGRPFLTPTPPTCAHCVPLASTLCPNLSSHPGMTLLVKHYRPWGVFGDYVDTNGRLRQGDVQFGSERQPRVMARHLVVEVLDYRKARRLNEARGKHE